MSGISAFPSFDYASTSTVPGANGQVGFAASFGTGSSIGLESAVYNGIGDVPPLSESPNASLIVTGGDATDIPEGYMAVYDLSDRDTVTGGSTGLGVYLQNNTTYIGQGGSDTVYAGGADTIQAGSGASSVYGGASGATVAGGSGSLQFVGGSGAVSVAGGSGDTTLFGGTGSAASVLIGGTGNSTLVGGSGSGPTTLSGGFGNGPSTNDVMFGNGTGPTVFDGPQYGTALVNGTTGTGQELVVGGNLGTLDVALNNNADTVIAGTGGPNTIIAGSGPDIFGFYWSIGTSNDDVYGLKSDDRIVFLGGQGVRSEAIVNGSDVVTTTSYSTITFVGIDHTIFN